MHLAKIKDIGKVISGSTPDTNRSEYWNGDIPWVTPREIGQLESPYLTNTQRKITETGLNSCSASILPRGSILFTSRAPIGLVAIADIEVATNQGFKSLQLFEGYYPLYIYYTLKYFSKRLDYLGTGTTFKELSKNTFEKFEIPIPDKYDDQVTLANKLLEIDILIKLRKETVEVAEDLIVSIFFQMFGDPVLNAKGWDVQPLETSVSPDCPLTYGIVQPGDDYPNGVPLVRPVDLGKRYISKRNLKLIDPTISQQYNRTILKGDEILMSVRGQTGTVSLATEELSNSNVTRGIVPIKFNDDFDRIFGFCLLNSAHFKREIQKYTYGSTLQQINLSDLRKIKIIKPPKELQNTFSRFATDIFNLNEKQERSLAELENLFGSINQISFRQDTSGIQAEISNYSSLQVPQRDIETKQENYYQDSPEINTISNVNQNKKKEKSQQSKAAMIWDDVSIETIGNWVKEEYTGYHFNCEMLQNFLIEDYVTFVNYFSSEELKKNPSFVSKEDLKGFLFKALIGDSPFMRLKQHFYNAVANNFTLNLRPDDYELFKDRTAEQKSGIYFTIEEE